MGLMCCLLLWQVVEAPKREERYGTPTQTSSPRQTGNDVHQPIDGAGSSTAQNSAPAKVGSGTGATHRQDSGWEGAGRGRHTGRSTEEGGAVQSRLKMISLMFLTVVAYLVCDWLKTFMLIPTQKT